MTKIEKIQLAIGKSVCRTSNLTPLALTVPALSSLNIRHLMNNLGAISNAYMEHGVHRGGLFCSTICNNGHLFSAYAIDSFESDLNGEHAKPEFIENSNMCAPLDLHDGVYLIHKNSFDVHPMDIRCPIDLYLFDADHSEDSQCRALTHFLDAMTDEFIFCVDDWDFPEVSAGTRRGLQETGVKILFEQIFKGNNHDNEGWWNGFAVFLLKKKP